MNGLKILNQALALMGIPKLNEEVRKTGLYMLKVVCEDLNLPPVESVENKLPLLSEKEITALTYGVATRLALSMGDEYLKDIFEKAYLKKRNELKSSVLRVKNSIFTGEMEDE